MEVNSSLMRRFRQLEEVVRSRRTFRMLAVLVGVAAVGAVVGASQPCGVRKFGWWLEGASELASRP